MPTEITLALAITVLALLVGFTVANWVDFVGNMGEGEGRDSEDRDKD